MPIDALSVLCAQLTRDLLAIAKFLLLYDKSVAILTFDINSLTSAYACWRFLSQSASLKIGSVAAGRASAVKVPWSAFVCVAAAGLLVVMQ